jgi:hypothetical protein
MPRSSQRRSPETPSASNEHNLTGTTAPSRDSLNADHLGHPEHGSTPQARARNDGANEVDRFIASS